MDRFDREELKRLAASREDRCVSIFMPAHRSGKENEQDSIRLKNLIRQAQEKLVESGLRAPEARDMLEPAQDLVVDQVFWLHQSDGLVVFLSPAGMECYRVPLRFSEDVLVGPKFYLLPLFPLVSRDQRYYVLALSPKQVRLLDCTRFTAREVDVPDMPKNYEEFGRFLDEEKSVQFHSETQPVGPPQGALGGIKRRAAMYHGHGAADEGYRKLRLSEYCQMIENAVTRKLVNESAPLVLACDTTLAGIYPEMNAYRHLVDDTVGGSPDEVKKEVLRDRAWTILEPSLEQARQKAIHDYPFAASRNRGSERLEEILPAVHDGRVDRLLVAAQAHRWGRFDPVQRALVVDEEPGAANEDLLNLAAVETWLRDGAVEVFSRTEMPNQSEAAAIYRY